MRRYAPVGCTGAVALLGALAYWSAQQPELRPLGTGGGLPGLAAELAGLQFLESARRLALFWHDGAFELWDTEIGKRLGNVRRLPRPVGWCLGSPDGSTIATGDRLPSGGSAVDIAARHTCFTPGIYLWNARSGTLRRHIPVPQAEVQKLFAHEWHAHWLEASRLLVVRLWRERPGRPAFRLRLFLLDTDEGKIIRASREYRHAGERVHPSPDGTLALITGGPHLKIFDLERLRPLQSWGEPHQPELVRWATDSETVYTARDDPTPELCAWNARSGRLLWNCEGNVGWIGASAFSAADGFLRAREDSAILSGPGPWRFGACVLVDDAGVLSMIVDRRRR